MYTKQDGVGQRGPKSVRLLFDSKTRPHSHPFSAGLGEIEAHLAATQVEHGASYFNARRELWSNGKKKIPRPDEIADSITRLEDMVRDPRALRSSSVWESGLGSISKRLTEGGRLKYSLPMHLLVCNTTHSAMRSSSHDRVFSDKNPVCRLDSRWNMAAGRPSPGVRWHLGSSSLICLADVSSVSEGMCVGRVRLWMLQLVTCTVIAYYVLDGGETYKINICV